MFCFNCGKEIPNDVTFCPNCGAKISQTAEAKINETPQQHANNKQVFVAKKSRFVAIVLCIFLGLLGAHDFYLKREGCAIAKLLITLILGWCIIGLIINGIWCFFDFFIILLGGDSVLMTEEEYQALQSEEQKQKQKELEEFKKTSKMFD